MPSRRTISRRSWVIRRRAFFPIWRMTRYVRSANAGSSASMPMWPLPTTIAPLLQASCPSCRRWASRPCRATMLRRCSRLLDLPTSSLTSISRVRSAALGASASTTCSANAMSGMPGLAGLRARLRPTSCQVRESRRGVRLGVRTISSIPCPSICSSVPCAKATISSSRNTARRSTSRAARSC